MSISHCDVLSTNSSSDHKLKSGEPKETATVREVHNASLAAVAAKTPRKRSGQRRAWRWNDEDLQYFGKRDSTSEGELKLMSDTELQIARQQTSEQKLRVLKQQSVVLSLRREGGQQLDEAVALLDSMKDELIVMESHLDRLIFNA